MSNDILVTIGSASYNTGPALLNMIRSILAQTLDNWELILLDDGSTYVSPVLSLGTRS